MTETARSAAQYIRMSTEQQDLSPLVQKEAIAAYAAAKGFEIVASYEDEGRSGVHLKNRPGLLKLLRDVTEASRFSAVLVYDVSRWGRFQDTDAAAYYEYHCKLHGSDVIYVAEVFGDEANPISALLKSVKRTMAAEYSRDLSKKVRAGQHKVVSLGFQMGALPSLGYRRCSVSTDGLRRTVLESGQRKIALTDRIEWVLGPAKEVALVKRIFELYARGASIADVALLGSLEGWSDRSGRPLSAHCIGDLLRNEALIGNFVWGRRLIQRSLLHTPESRSNGCIPRIIENATWEAVQRRVALLPHIQKTSEQLISKLKQALEINPMLVTRELSAQGFPSPQTYKYRVGGWAECLRQAGRDPEAHRVAIMQRTTARAVRFRECGKDLAKWLTNAGLPMKFNGRLKVLRGAGLYVQLRMLWSAPLGGDGLNWPIRIAKFSPQVDVQLFVRMEDECTPKDYLLAPPADVATRFPHWLAEQVADEISRFWCPTLEVLAQRLRGMADRQNEGA
jgi:DNA invertase Pin-like site-specific DNA recombinase